MLKRTKKNRSNTQKKYFKWTIKIVQLWIKNSSNGHQNSSNGQKIC